MKMQSIARTFLLLTSLSFTGCISQKPVDQGWPAAELMDTWKFKSPCYEAALVDQATTTLIHQLKRRDAEILDLEWLGNLLAKEYGEFQALRAVHGVWFILTQGEPIEKAQDNLWLADQSPRIRDVAWLIHYRFP